MFYICCYKHVKIMEEKKYTLDEVIVFIKAFHLDVKEGQYSKELLDWCNQWIENNIKKYGKR